MNLKDLSSKLNCREIEAHAALLSLFLLAIKTQNNVLEYHFKESEVEAFIARKYPKSKKLKIIKD